MHYMYTIAKAKCMYNDVQYMYMYTSVLLTFLQADLEYLV